MDPVSITGLAASIVGIIDIIGRTVDSLSGIYSRWKHANLTVMLMISQLSTVKAALNEIGEWISSDPAAETAHHQLVIDLRQSVNSCHLIVAFINHHISKFDWRETDDLTFKSKLRILLQDNATKDSLGALNSQVNALDLLLTACNA